MEITKEAIEKRRAQLLADHQQAIATIQAIGGAIQDCDYWLQLLETEAKPVEETQHA